MSETNNALPLFVITHREQWETLKEKLNIVIIKPKGEINLKTEPHSKGTLFLATFKTEKNEVIVKRLRDIELYVLGRSLWE